ncbi:MAG: ATP-dependent Clp protease adaptor ClpS [Phycisphaeraceae bacterium]
MSDDHETSDAPIDEPTDEKEAGTATKPKPAPATKPESRGDAKAKPKPPKLDQMPPYKVLLHNDDHNIMEHVVQSIVQLTPLKEFEAIRKMFEAHRRGLTLLLTTHKERAELYREQFTTKGLTVTIEPAK